MPAVLQTVPARYGIATFVPAGKSIKIINTSGTQVVDTWAFALHPPTAPEPSSPTKEKASAKGAKGDKKEQQGQNEGKKVPGKLGQKGKQEAEQQAKGGAERKPPRKLNQKEEEKKDEEQTPRTWSSYLPSLTYRSKASTEEQPAEKKEGKKKKEEEGKGKEKEGEKAKAESSGEKDKGKSKEEPEAEKPVEKAKPEEQDSSEKPKDESKESDQAEQTAEKAANEATEDAQTPQQQQPQEGESSGSASSKKSRGPVKDHEDDVFVSEKEGDPGEEPESSGKKQADNVSEATKDQDDTESVATVARKEGDPGEEPPVKAGAEKEGKKEEKGGAPKKEGGSGEGSVKDKKAQEDEQMSKSWTAYIMGSSSKSKSKAKDDKPKDQTQSKSSWSSYIPSGQSFSSYVPNTEGALSGFAKSHYRDPSKSYAEQLYNFSKTPVGAAGLSVATGSGTASSLYAAYSAYTKYADEQRNAPPMEFLSMPHTRSQNKHLRPKKGDTLYSNLRFPLMQVVEDTSPGVHDTLMSACDPQRYHDLGVEKWEEHGSCAENLVLALKEFNEKMSFKGPRAVGSDVSINSVPAPLNLFMNVPWEKDGALDFDAPDCKPGDYVRLKAERDVVVVMSACPQDILNINGNKPTDANFEVEGDDSPNAARQAAKGKQKGKGKQDAKAAPPPRSQQRFSGAEASLERLRKERERKEKEQQGQQSQQQGGPSKPGQQKQPQQQKQPLKQAQAAGGKAKPTPPRTPRKLSTQTAPQQKSQQGQGQGQQQGQQRPQVQQQKSQQGQSQQNPQKEQQQRGKQAEDSMQKVTENTADNDSGDAKKKPRKLVSRTTPRSGTPAASKAT